MMRKTAEMKASSAPVASSIEVYGLPDLPAIATPAIRQMAVHTNTLQHHNRLIFTFVLYENQHRPTARTDAIRLSSGDLKIDGRFLQHASLSASFSVLHSYFLASGF